VSPSGAFFTQTGKQENATTPRCRMKNMKNAVIYLKYHSFFAIFFSFHLLNSKNDRIIEGDMHK
jgi:hypothetical protein